MWTVLSSNWRLITGAVLALALVSYIGFLNVSRANLRAELAEARQAVETCHQINVGWKKWAEVGRLAVEKLEAETKAREDAVRKATKAAAEASAVHSARATAILSLKRSGEACGAADGLLTDYFRGMK